MITVSILHKFLFKKKVSTRAIPTEWRELQPFQFKLVAQLLLGKFTNDTEFLAKFTQLPIHRLDRYQQYKLSQKLNYLAHPDIRLDRFLLPKIGQLLAPGARLKGMSFEQFMLVDTAFNRYCAHEDECDLNNFIALLYLPKRTYIVLPNNIEKRLLRRYKPVDIARQIEEVEQIPEHMKYAVFLNYIFIKKWLSKAFPFLFPEAAEDEKPNPKKPFKTVQWLDIFDAFVGKDVANMEKYQSMAAATAFRILNKRIKEAQKR